MEMELENLIDSADDVTTPTEKSGDPIFKQCYRKGDVIYYAKPENINMYHKQDSNQRTDGSGTRASLESDGQTDTVNSGESLFKVFAFEQSSNDEDTEKCIAFWKTVMEKNLTPIKCTIIENKKNHIPTYIEKPKSLEEEEERSQASDENVADKIHKEYRDMWLSALREIQKKKLHEIKLTNRVRCQMCDAISSSVEQYADIVDKRDIKKEIKALNNWKSVSTKKKRQTSNKTDAKKSSSTDSSLIAPTTKRSQPSKTATQENKDLTLKTSDVAKASLEKLNTEDSSAFIKEKILRNLLPDTNTYVHRDVIEEKKRNGVYSQWRSNAVEKVCQCKNTACDCNINPAIVAIEKSEPNTPPCEETSFVECKKTGSSLKENTYQDAEQREIQGIKEGDAKQLESPSNNADTLMEYQKDLRTLFSDENVNRFEEVSTLGLADRKSTIRKRTLSLFLKCNCSASLCDCSMYKELLSRQQEEKPDWEMPKRSVVIPVSRRRSSLELYRKSFSKIRNLKEKDSQSSVQMIGRVPENTASSSDADFQKDQISLKFLNVEAKPSIMVQSHVRLHKSLSMLLNDCHCSNEECDCFHIEHVQKDPSLTDWDTTSVPERTVFEKKDSLELAKKMNHAGLDPERPSVRVLHAPSTFDDNSSIFDK